MSCLNPTLGRLLPGYLSGEVTGEEMEAFGEHLLECDECLNAFLTATTFEQELKLRGRESFAPGSVKEAVLEIVRHSVGLVEKGITAALAVGPLLRGEDFFRIATLPVAFAEVRSPERETVAEGGQSQSTILETPEFTATVTPDPQRNEVMITLTSLQIDLTSVSVSLLKDDGTPVSERLIAASPSLRELTFPVPEGRHLLTITYIPSPSS